MSYGDEKIDVIVRKMLNAKLAPSEVDWRRSLDCLNVYDEVILARPSKCISGRKK